MRPFKQGLSSFREHVYLRKGIYYFRIDIPTDLTHHFPTAEIKQSLKTKDPDVARLAANRLFMGFPVFSFIPWSCCMPTLDHV